jgi:uncharacterized coiled-coil protein SlyX
MSTTAFPTGGRAIVERLAAMFPDLFVNDDDQQRQLTIKIGEQFAFSYPGRWWGNKKRAGLSDAFRSKDSIAVKEDDGTTSVWDLFSSGLAILVHDGDLPVPGTHANLPSSEAEFMPCEPVNHLGGNPLPGEVPDPPSTPDTSELEARVKDLERRTSDQQDLLDEQGRKLSRIALLLESARFDLQHLRVKGRTLDKYAHSHPVDLPVVVSE